MSLTPFYPTERDDAVGCFVAEPLQELARSGVTHTIFVAQPFYRAVPVSNPTAPAAVSVRYFSLPAGTGLSTAGAFLYAHLLAKARRAHDIRKIDVIHAHGPLPCGHAAMLLARELGVPYVVTVHGLDAYSTRQVKGLAGEWCRRITQRVFASARRVIAISEHVRGQVAAGGVRARTSVVYNGVNAELFSAPEDGLQSECSILSVGNLIPTKGHRTLLRAVAAIRPDFRELKVSIIGDGPERGALIELAKALRIADCVEFGGRVSRRTMARALQKCALFVLPSSYEGLGCVYLEAMSAGKAAIGCRGQGIEEVMQHGLNGWLVGADAVEELAAGLSTLMRKSDLRQSIGHQARQTILKGFTLRHQAEALLRIYRECVK